MQVKLRNTFWSPALSIQAIYADIQNKAGQLHQSLLAKHTDTPREELEGMEINLQLPGMFAIANIEGDYDQPDDDRYDKNNNALDFIIQVDTIAPSDTDQYTADVLQAIHIVVP